LDISIVSQKMRKSLATGRHIRGNQSVKTMENIMNRGGTTKGSPSRYKNNFVQDDNYGDDYAVAKF